MPRPFLRVGFSARRDFAPAGPNRLWVADLTEFATWEGKLYLAVVVDAFSRRCVGWAMAEHMRAELVVEALEMAIWHRRPDTGLIHHSDRGGQPGLNGSSQRRVSAVKVSVADDDVSGLGSFMCGSVAAVVAEARP